MIYRGLMISSYEFSYTYIELNYKQDDFIKQEVFYGLRPLVPISSIFAAAIRVLVESMLYIIYIYIMQLFLYLILYSYISFFFRSNRICESNTLKILIMNYYFAS